VGLFMQMCLTLPTEADKFTQPSTTVLDMTPAESEQLNKNLAFVAGDTWQGIPSFSISPPPLNPLVLVRMDFRNTLVSVRTMESLSSAKAIPETPSVNQIVIDDAINWQFHIPEQKLQLKAGTYAWQIETRDSLGHIQTYCQGTVKVYSDIVTP